METVTVKAPDIAHLIKGHENRWVAFSPDYTKLVAIASTLHELRKKAELIDIVVMKVMPPNIGYAPTTLG